MMSRDCWQPMTAPGYRGYSLTHQVFYLEIAEAVFVLHIIIVIIIRVETST